jgi:opacity protein-like surface antigen
MLRNFILLTTSLFVGFSTYAQTYIGAGIGYQYFQSSSSETAVFTNYPFIPHVWLELLHRKDNVYSGVTAFANEDRIKRTWPDEGTYTQCKKQVGIGFVLGADFSINEKHALGIKTTFGRNFQTWSVASDNPFLLASIQPREEIKKGFFTIGITYSYALNEKYNLDTQAGVGENNLTVIIRRKI